MRKYILILIFLTIGFELVYSQQDTVFLQEVEIRNFNIEHVPCIIERISSVSIEQSSVNDVGELLRSIPNVSGVKKGAAGIDPVVRGFKFSQLNVMIDGAVKIEGGCPNRMDPTTAHIDINDVKEINILKGPFALKYGPSFGGVINLVTWRPVFYKGFQTHAKAFFGLQCNGSGYKSNISVRGGNGLFTYEVAGGAKKYDDYKDGDGSLVKASLTGYYGKANIGFRISKNHIIDGGVSVSIGKDIDFPALSMDQREDNTMIYKLNYLGVSIGKSINSVKIKSWYSGVHHVMDNNERPFSDTVVAVSSVDAVDAGIRSSVNYNVGKNFLETGIDFEYIFKNGNRVKTMVLQPGSPFKVESLWDDATIYNIGLYTEFRRRIKSVDWVTTCRVDFNNAASSPMLRNGVHDNPVYENRDTQSSFINVSFNGGFNWHINRDNDFSFSIGRGVRSPDMTERFIVLLPVGYDCYDYLGNSKLTPEVNYEVDISFEHVSKLTCQLKPSIFLSYVTNFIGSVRVPPSVVRPQTKGVIGVKQFMNLNHVWLAGFDISWTSPVAKPWQINANVAYTYGVIPDATGYKVENGQIVDEYLLHNDPLPEIPPFEFNTNFKYKFFKGRLVPELHWRVVAAQKHVSESYGEQDSRAFQVVNITLNYKFEKYVTLRVGVNNVFNTLYYEHLNRNIIGSSRSLNEPGRNFFVNLIFKF